ncbi:hypothetical protein R6Z07M_002483 [Ovis aries]
MGEAGADSPRQWQPPPRGRCVRDRRCHLHFASRDGYADRLGCRNLGRGSPAIIRMLGEHPGPGEPRWLRAGEAMIRIILSA